jgi:peptidyl-tRNA hydrolase, PTH2 family
VLGETTAILRRTVVVNPEREPDVGGLMEPKQVIVMRRDLGMRRGKEIAQGAHASMMWLSHRIRQPSYVFKDAEQTWLEGPFTKVCVRVDSEEELLGVVRAAEEAGVMVHLCVDAGRTEFHGVATPTCCAVGPDFPDRIDPITAHLKLL